MSWEMKKYKKRPIFKLPLSEFEAIVEIIDILMLVFSTIITYRYWGLLQKRVPTHFNLIGQISEWGGKGSLLLMPIAMVIIYFFITILEKYPHIYNYPKPITKETAKNQYRIARQCLMIIKTIILSFLSYFYWQSIQSAILLKRNLNFWFILIFIVALFSTLGYYIYKLINNSEVI